MWMAPPDDRCCPNCGTKWDKKECRFCGFKPPNDRKETVEVDLVFCTECACHFLGGCTNSKHKVVVATPKVPPKNG